MKSRVRLRETFSRIADENLRALVAQLVQIHVEHADSSNAPLSHYRHAIDAYAGKYGSELDTTFLEGGPSREGQAGGDQDEERTHEAIVTLESLTLSNFGSYCSATTFDLSPKGGRNVTAVVGSNGDGKSTLFVALNWAMYGDEFLAQLKLEKQKGLEDLVNRSAIAEAADRNGTVSTEVTLHFSIRGVRYYVTRAASSKARRIGDEYEYSVQQEQTRLRKIDAGGNHTELLPSAMQSLLSGLPSHVRDFYLFDGERINRFVAAGSQALIRKAIRRVMGIEALEKTADELGRVSTGFRKEARDKSTGELASVRDDLLTKQNQKAEARKTIEEKQAELVELRSRIDELDNHLRSMQDTRPLQERRNEYENQIKQYREDEERLVYELRDLAADASLLMAAESVSKLVGDLDEQRQAGVIPGPISKHLMSDLLELNRCICGTDLSEGSAARKTLESALADLARQAEDSEIMLGLFYELSGLDNQLRSRAETLDGRRAELARLRQRRRHAVDALAEVTAQLEGMEVVDRTGWERERANTRRQEVQVEATIQNANAKLVDLDRAIEALKSKERSLEASQIAAQHAAHKRDWSEAAEEALRRVFHEFAAGARVEVMAATERLWKSMLLTVASYQVEVTDDFELLVYDEFHQSSMQELSMGQQQCLGLAFITAVAQVAESRPPLVIDMPFGRLGAEVAASVAAALPTLTEQLILFVLPDTEWNSQTRTAIAPFLAREYGIKLETSTGCTRIVPVQEGVA